MSRAARKSRSVACEEPASSLIEQLLEAWRAAREAAAARSQ